ncbi:TetR/AcrR family transcriptional regulator [Streptacidiphilus albus]|uniref:TetR/AcrR family transcriptional regulator n=1 Tax=Streptacidiphilus albus TaxID=105425 RepID=UPI0005A8ADE6|nr:TetR/AcrR family transcriptional regulator [Streptacidiphilus albus]
MDDAQAVAGAQPLGRRERNKLRVKSRLYDSALQLFTEKGYEQTSVDEIAEAADVARGTFFNHFQRKEDLIAAWGESRREYLRRGLAATDVEEGTSLQSRLELCMGLLARINTEERAVTRAMLTAWVKAGRPLYEEPYAGELFAGAVETAQRRGEIAPTVDPLRVGNLLRDAYLGTLYRWTQLPEGEFHLDAELRAITDIVLTGIAGAGAADAGRDSRD